jgi:chorismate synthase
MNTFGRILQIALFGESHGEGVGILIDGCPAGLPLAAEDFSLDLRRRQGGAPGTTPRIEADIPLIKSGLLNQKTTGAPLLILFENRDVQSKDYQTLQNTPRPGHADFVASHKFRKFNDYRGSGHFSGRLTVALVAAGVIAKKILAPAIVEATLLEAGGSKEIEKAVQSALEENDSIGGVVECRARGLPVGLGEPFFDSIESQISHLVFAVPGIKGIEFGSGFACTKMKGTECNDVIVNKEGKTKTNHAGGINGGLTNGNELIFRVAVRPPSSVKKEQSTINLQTGETVKISVHGRHDACIALRMPVILEAVTAIVLVDFMLIEQEIPRVMG